MRLILLSLYMIAFSLTKHKIFSSSFLNICYNTLTREKRLVYAYDELQNLSNSSLQPPEELFGVNQNGEPKVSFEYDSNGHSRQDLILNICYRNSRPVLATAHALGFGIYRDTDPKIGTGIIQIFENKNLWKEIGYDHFMPIEDGREIILERSTISSPLFLERDSDLSDLVSFSSFKTYEEQANWLLTEIKKNIEEDELRPEDIIVINPNPFTTKKNVAFIRQLLFNAGINSHLTGVDTSPDVFFKEESDSIAFTGIYRAKGNEAGMVYVINAEECYSSTYNLSIHRNRLFTAITRSKAWVRVLGVGPEMDELLTEFNRIKENDFKLKFVYPTEEQRKHLNIVNREVPASKMKKIDRRKVGVKELIDDLEKGEIFIEDLDDDARNKLLHLLAKKK
jgi:superfamily I DNA and RNA helicase